MGKSVDSAQATRFEAVPKQMAGLEIAPPPPPPACSVFVPGTSSFMVLGSQVWVP